LQVPKCWLHWINIGSMLNSGSLGPYSGLPQAAASNGQELQGLRGLRGLRGTQRFSCTGRMRDAGAVAVAGAAWGAHSIHRRVGRKQNEHRNGLSRCLMILLWCSILFYICSYHFTDVAHNLVLTWWFLWYEPISLVNWFAVSCSDQWKPVVLVEVFWNMILRFDEVFDKNCVEVTWGWKWCVNVVSCYEDENFASLGRFSCGKMGKLRKAPWHRAGPLPCAIFLGGIFFLVTCASAWSRRMALCTAHPKATNSQIFPLYPVALWVCLKIYGIIIYRFWEYMVSICFNIHVPPFPMDYHHLLHGMLNFTKSDGRSQHLRKKAPASSLAFQQ